MKITIESTDKIVTIVKGGVQIEARLWEGETDSGIPVQCLVARIAAPSSADQSQFMAELREQKPPTPESQAFPLRMLI